MARYIDANLLKETIENAEYFDISQIDEAPTADVVEVVRCKDCKYKEGSACDYSAVYVRPNGYCQWGERREDE